MTHFSLMFHVANIENITIWGKRENLTVPREEMLGARVVSDEYDA